MNEETRDNAWAKPRNRGEEAAKVGENNRGIKLETMGWARWGGGTRERKGALATTREKLRVIIFTSGRISKTKELKIARFIRRLPKGSPPLLSLFFSLFFYCLFGKNHCRLAAVTGPCFKYFVEI